MIAWSPLAAPWLVQAATAADTQIVKQVAEPRNWFDTVSGVTSILMSVALFALCVGLIPAAWNFRKSYKKVSDLLDKVYGDVNPIMRHASTIADNVNYVTTSIRVDVQQVNQTIATANERLQEAVRLTERRLNEFNALLDVVQREAEGAFVSAASTVRGVRAGAATFRGELDDQSVASAAEIYGEYDDLEDDLEDELDDDLEDELEGELDDGLADEPTVELAQEPEPGGESHGIVSDAPGGGERPRIRPRGHARGSA